MIENIENVLAVSDRWDWQAGRAWYADARDWSLALARQYKLPAQVVVGVLCALSPRNRWERNLVDTQNVLAAVKNGLPAPRCGTFNKNVEKAMRIALDCNVDYLRGRKVESFLSNILDPDSRLVTVDVWAARIADGDIYAAPYTITDSRYADIELDYQTVADARGELPYVVQAVTWVTARRLVSLRLPVAQMSLFA